LRWAAPLDVDGDGRQEIAAFFSERDASARSTRIELLRWDGNKLLPFDSAVAYSVSAAAAAATGDDLVEIDLLVEVEVADDELHFGGLYLHRGRRGPRNVAPLAPRSSPREGRRPAPAPGRGRLWDEPEDD
jgi:hypothetical protein